MVDGDGEKSRRLERQWSLERGRRVWRVVVESATVYGAGEERRRLERSHGGEERRSGGDWRVKRSNESQGLLNET